MERSFPAASGSDTLNADEPVRADWMETSETRAVVGALQSAGHRVRFVGGCVRDTLVSRKVEDIDIATDAPPDAVVEALEAAGLRAVPTGIAHGTVTGVSGGRGFEITTLRRDVETDGRHAKVAFTDDWEADAARRDLTINAMSVEPDGTLHDPFGGRADLRAGRVRFVGAAQDRIVEDNLRLLRYFRFYAHFGTPPADEAALKACRSLAPRLKTLSAERVRSEIMKLFAAENPVPAIALMREAGVVAHILPDATNLEALERLLTIEGDNGISAKPERRLMALLTPDADGLERLADGLRLSNAERDYLTTFERERGDVRPAAGVAGWRHAIYRLGAEAFRECVLIGWAKDGGDAPWADLLVFADGWSAKRFPLTGADILSRGIEPEKAVGEILSSIETWWIDGGFVADRASCLARLDDEIDRAS